MQVTGRPQYAQMRYNVTIMIRSLRGVVEATDTTSLVLGVQGIGYLVHMNVLRYGYTTGDELHLHTYLAVRETALDLYGFPSRDELAYFELLLEVPKIGPKSALQVLGQADLTVLTEAITAKDATLLHKLSGIGKKTAENIVQYLHDKLEDRLPRFEHHTPSTNPSDGEQTDATLALISLGYSPSDARSAVRSITTHDGTKDLITQALRVLAKN